MNIIRHHSVFAPEKIPGLVAIAGVGALGSALALQLAKLGLARQLVLFDHDLVDEHNVPNQVLFGPDDVGIAKVEAARLTIHALCGSEPHACRAVRLESREQLHGVTHLFVCVDSMLARESIFGACVENNFHLQYFGEGRMNARGGMALAFAPSTEHHRAYRDRLYPDSEVSVELGTCGNVLSIGATAMTLACQMTWHLINHVGGKNHWEEMSFGIDDLAVHHRGWLGSEHAWRRSA